VSQLAKREISRFPCKEHPCMPGSQTTRGQTGTRSSVPVHVAFRFNDSVGTPEKMTFVAQWLAYTYPCQRFALRLTAPRA